MRLILHEKLAEYVVIWNCVIVVNLVMCCAYHLFMSENLSLLGHYTVLTGKELLIFWRNIVPPSSGSNSCPGPLLGQLDPQDGGTLLLWSVSNYIPVDMMKCKEDLNLHQYDYKPQISYPLYLSKLKIWIFWKVLQIRVWFFSIVFLVPTEDIYYMLTVHYVVTYFRIPGFLVFVLCL